VHDDHSMYVTGAVTNNSAQSVEQNASCRGQLASS